MPDSKVLSYNDIDEGAGSYSSALDDKAFERKSDREEKKPQSSKVDSSINKESLGTGIKVSKKNFPVLRGLAVDSEEYGSSSYKDTSCQKGIPKNLFDDLNLNLQTLRLEAQQKELETARHISQLEKEVRDSW